MGYFNSSAHALLPAPVGPLAYTRAHRGFGLTHAGSAPRPGLGGEGMDMMSNLMLQKSLGDRAGPMAYTWAPAAAPPPPEVEGIMAPGQIPSSTLGFWGRFAVMTGLNFVLLWLFIKEFGIALIIGATLGAVEAIVTG